MSSDEKLQEVKLTLYNSQDTDVDFFLEPDGMSFTIPPGENIDIVLTQKEDVKIEICFKQDKEGVSYYSIGSFYRTVQVYRAGNLMYDF